MEKFYFEQPSIERKEDAIEYINEFLKYNSKINGTGALDSYIDNYSKWLELLEKDYKTIVSEKRVPAVTYFLVRESDNKIVGMINIRLALNETLKKSGGHIGYSIRPTERRKGYNKINLYLGLKVLQEQGVKEAMLSCIKDNIGSAKTMIALGAKLKEEFYSEKYQELEQNYLIDVDKSLNDYKKIYEPYISQKS